MLEFAERHKIVIKMRRGIGQFVPSGATLAEIAPDSETASRRAAFDEKKQKELGDLFLIDRHRTIEQDVGFGIRQIVDIALKALSPGIDDTTTAISCIDNLGEILGEITRRRLPEKTRAKNGTARVLVVAPGFDDYVETAFDQIRIGGKANQAILERLLTTLAFLAGCTSESERRAALRRQVELTGEFADATLATEYEKQKVRLKLAEAEKIFEETQVIYMAESFKCGN